jgi:hypothetical protein
LREEARGKKEESKGRNKSRHVLVRMQQGAADRNDSFVIA